MKITNTINLLYLLVLYTRIEKTRELMIATGLKEGFTSPNTISVSQDLDLLLNDLQCMLLKQKYIPFLKDT